MHARMDRMKGYVRNTVRHQAVKRADFSCEACGKWTGTWGHAHHIKPRSRGGKWTLDNIEYLCSQCHADRHTKGCH
jgi:5-methylcytosine-specific restriction endonuclease McrA